MTKHDVYLAGPMTNIPGFNFAEFLRVRSQIEVKYGYRVFCPASHEIEAGLVPYPEVLDMQGTVEELSQFNFDKSEALRRDMNAIADAKVGTVLMSGWWNSSGARLEAQATAWVGKKLLSVCEDDRTFILTPTPERELQRAFPSPSL